MSERNIKRSRVRKSPGKLPASYVMEEQVGFLMRVAMQRHTSIFMALMAHDLTQTQFAVLAKLVEVGTCSQNHLGRLIYLDHATIKGVIDRLRRRKLVAIQANPEDRRRSMITLTDGGNRAVKDAIASAHRITAETLTPLKPPEQRQIVRLLQKMI
jgi:MarR family transcriptional regulator, lower aerobic nicotinate degradation pathway regulator